MKRLCDENGGKLAKHKSCATAMKVDSPDVYSHQVKPLPVTTSLQTAFIRHDLL